MVTREATQWVSLASLEQDCEPSCGQMDIWRRRQAPSWEVRSAWGVFITGISHLTSTPRALFLGTPTRAGVGGPPVLSYHCPSVCSGFDSHSRPGFFSPPLRGVLEQAPSARPAASAPDCMAHLTTLSRSKPRLISCLDARHSFPAGIPSCCVPVAPLGFMLTRVVKIGQNHHAS